LQEIAVMRDGSHNGSSGWSWGDVALPLAVVEVAAGLGYLVLSRSDRREGRDEDPSRNRGGVRKGRKQILTEEVMAGYGR
jgi:hypothetical protein